jgi:hypothetical protein
MTVPPLEGSPERMAEELRAYAREGIGHVQLVVDPITEASVAALAPVLELLDQGCAPIGVPRRRAAAGRGVRSRRRSAAPFRGASGRGAGPRRPSAAPFRGASGRRGSTISQGLVRSPRLTRPWPPGGPFRHRDPDPASPGDQSGPQGPFPMQVDSLGDQSRHRDPGMGRWTAMRRPRRRPTMRSHPCRRATGKSPNRPGPGC